MARSFNGTSDFGSVSIDLSVTPRLTVACWIYWNSFSADGDRALEYGTDWFTQNGFELRPNHGSGTFRIGTGDGVNQEVKSISRPSGAAWHHYAVSIDRSLGAGAQLVSAYVDGFGVTMTPVASQDIPGNFGNRTLYLMAHGGVAEFGGGRMADLALWIGSALPSAVDAGALAAGRRANWGGLSVQPAYYWPMIDGSGAPAAGGGAITWVGGAPIADPPQLDPFGVASAGMLWQLQAMQANRARSLRRAAARP